MKRVGIMIPANRDKAAQAAIHAAQLLQDAGVEVYTENAEQSVIPDAKELLPDTPLDAIITLGGDGTLLRGAIGAAQGNYPVLGINLGHTGFLTETEPEDLDSAIHAMLAGEYELDTRPMLRITTENGIDCLAVNDAAISRGGYGRLISMNVLVDGDQVGEYRGDGLVVATPTGSTGYSLSAGGPIMAPGVHGMVITPVCAHSLQHRPVVVAGRSEIELSLCQDDEMTAILQVDGQTKCTLRSGDRVHITRPAEQIQLIRLKPMNFFTIVRQKLIEWST